MKALIISVGTGTRPTKEAVESLANALVFSVRNHNPDKIFFVVSQESLNTTLPKIMEKTHTENCENIQIQNPDDIHKIYENLQQEFRQIKKDFDQVAIDYTSGTKAMTSALTILGTIYEADALSYITGERMGGVVQAGTEKLHVVQPHFATTEQKVKTAIQLFNRNQFDATASMINQIERTTKDTQMRKRLDPFRSVAQAYSLWDKFQHHEAFKALIKVNLDKISLNKRFLGQLLKTTQPEPYYVADLINNAKRRGVREQKYDDAVARLYRTMELLAQYQLRKKYQIDTKETRIEDLSQTLVSKWQVHSEGKPLKIPMEKAYELLQAKGDPLGVTHNQDDELKDLLNKRNESILAHGHKPVTKHVYSKLLRKALDYASFVVDNLDAKLRDSAFIEWSEQP